MRLITFYVAPISNEVFHAKIKSTPTEYAIDLYIYSDFAQSNLIILQIKLIWHCLEHGFTLIYKINTGTKIGI